ncbi:MAG TPA: sulfotransferase domain-containing protein [Phycisphaerae bacterium]|nr:sulfotransferase domain-containing protein [Phycisphaerae bacterium]
MRRRLREASNIRPGTVFRWLTAELRDFPDFVCIGAGKSGTTALCRYLIEHPCVLPAWRKEVGYFSLRYHKGPRWYRSQFPLRATKRRIARRHGGVCLTGEATPYYLSHPDAARRMHELLPDVKLFALLRNPVDRAISHYYHTLRVGSENLPIEEAIEAEKERLAGIEERLRKDPSYANSDHSRFSYVGRGLYVDQLKQWHKYYPREQLLVIKAEDFFADPRSVFHQVLEFLGLPPWEPEAFPPHNVGKYAERHEALRKRLAEVFEPHNRRLYEYLGVEWRWED